jgi:hypothetical protein
MLMNLRYAAALASSTGTLAPNMPPPSREEGLSMGGRLDKLDGSTSGVLLP